MPLILFITLFIQAGCSSYIERSPAQAEHDMLSEIMSFSSTVEGKSDFKDKVVAEFDNYILPNGNFSSPYQYELVQSKSLPEGKLFQVELVLDTKKDQLLYRIYHAPKAFQDEIATFSMLDLVIKLLSVHNQETHYDAFEIYYNAKNGDPFALNALVSMREDMLFYHFNKTTLESSEFKKFQKELLSYKNAFTKEINLIKAQRSKDKLKRKSALDALDKALEAKQLKTMVAKGDRAGVANLLKKYLPWEEMAPFEKQFWETYLEVVAKPVPLEQRVLIYRGLDEDAIYKAATKGAELTEEEAITDSKAFIMSTLLVKNQGSWNRRLRSLEAMNDKYITRAKSEEFSDVSRISVMFSNHSGEPKGSPFISFTPNIKIAEEFGSKRISSYLIDPRLLNYNYTSIFDHEIEHLLPLTTFPDELVGIADVELIKDQGLNPDRHKYLEKRLEQLITEEYGAAKKGEIITKIKRNSYSFFKKNYAKMPAVKTGKSPASSNLAFYKKFLTKDDPKPVLSPKGELGCKDIMELFWMVN